MHKGESQYCMHQLPFVGVTSGTTRIIASISAARLASGHRQSDFTKNSMLVFWGDFPEPVDPDDSFARFFNLPIAMSRHSQSPLRIASLFESATTSYVPSTSTTKVDSAAIKQRTAMIRDDSTNSLANNFQNQTELKKPETTRIWGLDYHAVDMEQTLDYLEQVIYTGRPSYVVTANLNYAMLCAKNLRLAAFTQNSALTLCDGMPILWRSKLNAIKLPDRVAGSDLIYRLAERCADKKLRVYFYGASEGVAEKAAVALKNLYPKLAVAGVQCPPFRACSSEEIRSQVARIKRTKPDLLFVALGQPKGEYWIEDHLQELEVPLTIQLGASFDFVAGNATRAPKLLQKIGLEWLYRAVKDPVRLAPRYFSNLLFLAKALRRELIEKLS